VYKGHIKTAVHPSLIYDSLITMEDLMFSLQYQDYRPLGCDAM
jgi:hypothetical protein